MCSSDLVEVRRQIAVELQFHTFGTAFAHLAISRGSGIEVGVVLFTQVIHRGGDGGVPTDRFVLQAYRSEERRVGKEGRSRWSPYH